MSDQAIRDGRQTLNEAIVFVASRVITQNITNQTIAQFIDEQVKRIEGETSTSSPIDRRRNPQLGQISEIERIRQNLNQLADAVIADPALLDPEISPVGAKGKELQFV